MPLGNLNCIPSTSYSATPEFLQRSVHVITAISTPIHALGLYIILTKTPRAMSGVKWYFVNLHTFIVIYDHFMGTLSIPYLLLPTPSGYSLGILPKFGVPDLLIVVLVFLSCGYVLLGMLAIFENRFHIICMFSWKPYWEKCRRVWLAFHYVFIIVIFIPFWYFVPEQEPAIQKVFETLPCLPEYLHDAPLFVLTESPRYHVISLFGYMLLGTFESALFIFFVAWNVIEQVRTKKMSRKTFNLQVKFMIALLIQMIIPLILMIAPLTYTWGATVLNYYNQKFMNIAIIMGTSHGVISTFVMIFIHYPYRTAFFALFEMRRPKSSTGESKIGYRQKKDNVVSVGPTQI